MSVIFAGNILVQTNGGPLPIALGGTGQTTAQAAINALLPVQSGQAGKVLTTDGTNVSWSATAGGAPGGSDTQIQFNDSGTFGGSPNFVINKTSGALTALSTISSNGLMISGANQTTRVLQYQTSGSNRWLMLTNNTNETGSNAGSNFEFIRVADNGLTQNQVFTVDRSTGIVDFKTNPTVNGSPINSTTNASSLTGTTLASNVVNSSLTSVGTLSSLTVSGSVSAGTLSGNMDASNITSGLINEARLGTGTASSSTFLRGDGTWASVNQFTGGLLGQIPYMVANDVIGFSPYLYTDGNLLLLGPQTPSPYITIGYSSGNAVFQAKQQLNVVISSGDVTSANSSGNISLAAGNNSTAGFIGGNISISAGNNTAGSSSVGGNVTINSGTGNTTGGSIILKTNGVESFRILSSGAWSAGSSGSGYGSAGQVLVSNGSGGAPSWSSSASISSSNISGGAANEIPYQSAPNTTAFSSNLQFNGSSLLTIGGSLPITVNGSTATITATGSNSNLNLVPNGSGSVVLGTSGTGVIQSSASQSLTLQGNTSLNLVAGTGAILLTVPTGTSSTTKIEVGGATASDYATNLNDTSLVNKYYVDNISAGVNVHLACETSSTAPLPSCIYNNGLSGVGATLTATSNGSINTPGIGGYTTLSTTSRVLIKDQTNQIQNGIYDVTQLGDGSNPWILTRSSDFDGTPTNEVVAGDTTYVQEGTLNGTQWTQITVGSGHSAGPPAYDYVVIGTDNIVFTQLSGAGTYTAGSGINISSNTISNTGVLSFSAGSTGFTPNSATTGAITLGGTLAATNGGTGQSTYVVGDILYASSTSALSRLAAATSGQVLTSNGAGVAPSWQTFSVSAGSLTGTTLASNVVNSSLTSVGTLTSLTVSGTVVAPMIVTTSGATTQQYLRNSGAADVSFSLQNSTTGVTSSSGLALIEHGSGDATLWNYFGGYLRFGTNNAERLRLTSSGEWQISGSVGTSGQVLTSNGAGTSPTWQGFSVSAGSLTGTTLASNVVSSSLTSVGTLTSLTVSGTSTHNGTAIFAGPYSVPAVSSVQVGTNSGGASNTPLIQFYTSGSSANNRIARMYVSQSDGSLSLDFANDAVSSATTWLNVTRSSNTASLVTLTSTGINLAVGTGGLQLNGSVGTSGQVLTSNGSGAAPTWQSVSATTATNIAGGAAGSIPYQTAASTTGFIAGGTSGFVLTSNGASVAPTWQVVSTLADSTTIGTTQNTGYTLFGQTGSTSGANTLTIRPGTNSGGTPGLLTVQGGAQSTVGNQAGNATFAGGDNSASSGAGGAGSATLRGGDVTNGASTGSGGNLTLRGGNQAGTSNGGNVSISGGTSGTAANAGTITLNTNATTRMTFNANGTITTGTGSSVDFGARYTELSSAVTATATTNLDLSLGNVFDVTMSASITTLTKSNAPASGRVYNMTLFLTQSGAGSFTVNWTGLGTVKWAGGTTPTLTTTSGKTDIVVLVTKDGGSTWYGMVTGLNF